MATDKAPQTGDTQTEGSQQSPGVPSDPAKAGDDDVILTKGQRRKQLEDDYLTGKFNYNQLAEKYDLEVSQVEEILLPPEELAVKRGVKAPSFIPGRD